ncbi:metallophosphoesterase domain-containing protein 1-like isoform X2 [Amphibalanus amphitrite]|uniref:metallophosphoesterase domain-containing protein 1-like isoform X2 n=2 Tax=Amphibalanus amphitrite TaxID=1232801 RepID=UPI001C929F9B|nr:metallophosphoesterase domain-containing protein 1-like isoform X2 [Amphibalanus amphitrite]
MGQAESMKMEQEKDTNSSHSQRMPSIEVHPLSHQPTAAWEELKQSQQVIKINTKIPTKPPGDRKLRFVCMSDTHSLTPHLTMPVPDGDVLIHAGDFTKCGRIEEVELFNNWLASLPHRHKIVIAGNHELSFDPAFTRDGGAGALNALPTLGCDRRDLEQAVSRPDCRSRLSGCTYLQDESVTVSGITVYGSPWQPEFCDWAFNVPRGRPCLEKWLKIPENVDVLITHSPPIGHGDLTISGVRAGCVELLSVVQQRVKPKYHVFGHIHEGYGVTTDGKIVYVNASTCDISYVPCNPPIVFDVTIPDGFSKH